VHRIPTDPANGVFDYVFEPDGNLATEFVAMEEVYRAEMIRRSNDPYWCLLPQDQPLMQRRDTYGDPTLALMPSNRLWECLDIAGPSTLGALNRSALNFWCPTSTDCAWTFEALTSEQTASDTLFGGTTLCDMKVVGDGTVNSLDIAVLMYAQFGEGPYEHIFLPGQEAGRFNPRTTYGRDRTQHQCGNGMLPNQYQLQLSTDYCLAGHFPPYPPIPPMPPFAPPGAPASGRRLSAASGVSYSSSGTFGCLDNADGQCAANDARLTEYLVAEANARTSMRHMRAVASRWASTPAGEWSRVRLPGTLLAMELFLINAETDANPVNNIQALTPPPFNCTTAACAPEDPGIVLRFRRRPDLLPPNHHQQCAYILKSSRNILEGNVVAIRQFPPERACPFDLFIWIPAAQAASAENARCAGKLGVDVGSTAMDGMEGTIQLDVSCATEFSPPAPLLVPNLPPVSLPPSQLAPPPPQPARPPPPLTAKYPLCYASFAVTIAMSLDSFESLAYKTSLSALLPDITPSDITTAAAANGAHVSIVTDLQGSRSVMSAVQLQLQDYSAGSFAVALDYNYDVTAIGNVTMRCSVPPHVGGLCTDECIYANNGACQDGGPASILPVACALGTDCSDCGPWSQPNSPPLPPVLEVGPLLVDNATSELLAAAAVPLVAAPFWGTSSCTISSYAGVTGAFLASVSSWALVGYGTTGLAHGHGMPLSLGRVMQQVFNLQRASVRLPRNQSTDSARVCYREGGARSAVTTCIRRDCVRAAWWWEPSPPSFPPLASHNASSHRSLATATSSEAWGSDEHSCFAWAGATTPRLVEAYGNRDGGCCDAAGGAIDSLINLLLLCAIVLVVLVVLHLLYICRMRHVYRKHLHNRNNTVHPIADQIQQVRAASDADGVRSVRRAPLCRGGLLATSQRAVVQLSTTSDEQIASNESWFDAINQQSAVADSPPCSPPSTAVVDQISSTVEAPLAEAFEMAFVNDSPFETLPSAVRSYDVAVGHVQRTMSMSHCESTYDVSVAHEMPPLIPYATALIWPNAEVFVLVLFAPLLAGKSAAALAHAYITACCTLQLCWLPIVVLLCIAYAVLRTFRVLWRFSGTAASQLFVKLEAPLSVEATPDPIFRALNRVRAACGFALIDRFVGRYHVPHADELAHESTMHILSRPFGYWGHDFKLKPATGAHALYSVWIGDGRGRRPGYVFITLVLNILLQMALSASVLQAAFTKAWLVQGLFVIFLLILGALFMLCLAPTCDRLLSMQDLATYVLNALAAMHAFSAYHIDSVDETSALTTSDALTLASIWLLVTFAVYDAFAVAFINRIHAEGSTAICRAICSVPLDALRFMNMISTTIVGKDLLRIPSNPYASNAAPLMTSIAQEPSSEVGSSPLSRRELNNKDIRATNAADELARSETTFASTYCATRYARAALTAFMGGPPWHTSERGYPHQEPGYVSKPITSKQRNHFDRRIMRMPSQLGVISIRHDSRRQ